MGGTFKHDLKEIRESLEFALDDATAAFWDSEPRSHERAMMMYVKPQIEKLLSIVNKELDEADNDEVVKTCERSE